MPNDKEFLDWMKGIVQVIKIVEKIVKAGDILQ